MLLLWKNVSKRRHSVEEMATITQKQGYVELNAIVKLRRSRMNFTYESYEELIQLLTKSEYHITDYQNYMTYEKCVILRHDVDNSLEKAVELAAFENHLKVHSTYFVLLATDLYNVSSVNSTKHLKKILSYGHEIGLHFDEIKYLSDEMTTKNEQQILERAIEKEAEILSQLINVPITCVSMHRPSEKTLKMNLTPQNIINSYSDTFFQDFKYMSDSRRYWREPVKTVITSGIYPRLHILTHPFWYHEQEKSLQETVLQYVNLANKDRYKSLAENIRDLESIMKPEEVIG